MYLQKNYKKKYCLSAELSIDLLLGDFTIPKQVIVLAQKGSGTVLNLPHNTSLLVYKDVERLPDEIELVKNLQVMPLPLALSRTTPSYFHHSPQKAEIALRSLKSMPQLIEILINNNYLAAAGRFIGSFRFLGMHEKADDLEKGLSMAGLKIKERNPFLMETPLLTEKETTSPHALRIKVMWADLSPQIASHFPPPLAKKREQSQALKQMEEIYKKDAYHSLSIEGYQVTSDLIERVQNGLWNPANEAKDTERHNALAARGYFEAFKKVEESIQNILKGGNSAEQIKKDLSAWFQALFLPSVQAGILSPAELYGWRRHQVYIPRFPPYSPH